MQKHDFFIHSIILPTLRISNIRRTYLHTGIQPYESACAYSCLKQGEAKFPEIKEDVLRKEHPLIKILN